MKTTWNNFSWILAGLTVGTLLAVGGQFCPARGAEAGELARQISTARIFPEPIEYVGETLPPADESEALWAVLTKLRPNETAAGLEPLERFIAEHPLSAWTPSLHANLGVYYQHLWRPSAAFPHLQAAFELTRPYETGAGRRVAEYALAQWASQLARFGLRDRLTEVIETAGTRQFCDLTFQAAYQRGVNWLHKMRELPGYSFACGTFALTHLGKYLGITNKDLVKFPTPSTGFSLFTLEGLGRDAKMPVTAVHRPAGDAHLVVPSVAHLKIDHYVALCRVTNGLIELFDSVDGLHWVDTTTINAEASGYFLAPSAQAPAHWRRVEYAESRSVFGKCMWGPSTREPGPSSGPCGEGGNGPSNGGPSGSSGGGGDLGVGIRRAGITGMGGAPSSALPGGGGGSDCPCPKLPNLNSSGDGTSGTSGGCSGCGNRRGMPAWEIQEPFISLWLKDQPMSYQPSKGPEVALRLYYHQREYEHRTTNDVPGFGPNWNCGWLGFVEVTDFYSQIFGQSYQARVFAPGGGARDYRNYTDVMNTDFRSHTHGEYDWASETFTETFPDGGRAVYTILGTNVSAEPWVKRAYLTARYVPQLGGQAWLSFVYVTNSGRVRLSQVKDADGKTNTITYHGTFPWLIAQVVNPFGHTNTFKYNSGGMLTNLVDVIGLASGLAYDATNSWLVTALDTPYGRTSFEYLGPTNLVHDTSYPQGVNRAIRVLEPGGARHLAIYREYTHEILNEELLLTNNLPAVFTYLLAVPYSPYMEDKYYYNSFYWDPRQYGRLSTTNLLNLTASDYLNSRWRNWLYHFDGPSQSVWLSEGLNMEQAPSLDGQLQGQQTWYGYWGREYYPDLWAMEGTNPWPSCVARRLPDGHDQFIRWQRNFLGQPLTEETAYGEGGPDYVHTRYFYYETNEFDLQSATDQDENWADAYTYNSRRQVLTHTDGAGDVTSYTYDNSSRLTSVKRPTGLTTTNLYGADGYLAKTIDLEINRTNTYVWTNGWVRFHTNELGLALAYGRDALGRLTNIAYPDGSAIRYTYTNLDLAMVVDRMGYTRRYAYDALRRLVAETDERTNTTRYAYCPCGSLEYVTNALGQVTSYFYDHLGRLTQVRQPDGRSITRTYDLAGRLETVYDGWDVQTNWYNVQGQIVAVSNAFGQLKAVTYDVEDRPATVTDANGVTVSYTYNGMGQVTSRTYPDSGVEYFQYAAGLLDTYTDPLVQVTAFGYDAAGRKRFETNANSQVTQFKYDAAGNLTNLVDGKSQNTYWRYDLYGRVTNKLDHLGAAQFAYRYDALGRLTNRWTPGTLHTGLAYDEAGNLTNVDYTATTDQRLAYDALNRLTNLVDGIGTNRYTYTSGGQLASEDGPWENDTVSYTYTNGMRIGLSLVQPGGGAWAQSYGYDAGGRLQSLASPAGGFAYSYGNEFGDLPGSLVRRIDLPSGAFIRNDYESVGRLSGTALYLSDGWSIINRHSYTYDVAGRRTQQLRAADDYVDYTYDPIGQLKSASGKEPSGANRWQEQLGYAYDAAGNLQYRTNHSLVQTFNLNNLNQISTATRAGAMTVAGVASGGATSVTVAGRVAYLYADGTFASTNHTVTNGINILRAIAQDGIGRWDTNIVTVNLPSTATYAWDLNGNLRTNGTRFLEYDDENQLVRITEPNAWKSEFSYDGKLRRRVRKDYTWSSGLWLLTSEIRYVYDGHLVLQERDGLNQPQVTYTRGQDLSGSLEGAGGIGGLLARTELSTLNPQLSTAFYHCDGNGNITMLINAQQVPVAKYVYDPFGNTLGMSGPLAEANLYRFSSKEVHVPSGLVYYLYRYYDPNLQRWPNRDPLGEGWQSTRGSDLFYEFGPWELYGGGNLYHYVYNNSITFIDAWGLDVYICSRDVQGTHGAGAHTWIEVIDSNGNTTTYSGVNDSGMLGVRKNHPPDCKPTPNNPKTSTCPIPPPSRMTQSQWDDAVKKSGENEMKKDKQREYKLFGGDGGNKSGNCHCVSRQIIKGAGGQIPPNYDPPGLEPGLR